MTLDHFPSALEIDGFIGVRGDISEPIHGGPGNIWVSCFEHIGQFVRGIGQRLEPAEHGILNDRLVDESLLTATRVPLDPQQALPDVEQAELLALVRIIRRRQSATASRSIRATLRASREYERSSCWRCVSTTSTGRLSK